MNENDGMSNQNEHDIPDQVVPATEKTLIESAWICPYEEPIEPQNKKPPDPPEDATAPPALPNVESPTDTEVHWVSLQYKLNLRLQAQRLR